MTESYCHCCGLSVGDYMPWGKDGKTPLWEICECCGIEYGYEDHLESALVRYREKWLANGAKWFSPQCKPENWSLEQQLSNLPVVLPLGITKDVSDSEV